jgi:hypothetical protein
MNIIDILIIAGLETIFLLFILIYFFNNLPLKDNACDCHNPQWCDKWCCGKENFTKAQQYSIIEICKHPNQLTRVLESSGTCETTIVVCADCDEFLTESKTDCR